MTVPGSVVRLARRLQSRIELSTERKGATYPWFLPVITTLAAVAFSIAAWAQRGGVHAPALIFVAMLLNLYPLVLWVPRAWLTPPSVEAATTLISVVLFLTHPVTPDLAPLLLMTTAGEVAAMSRTTVAGAVTAVNVVLLSVAAGVGRLDNVGVYLIVVVLGMEVGITMRWLTRALRAERDNTVFAQERAILGERQRLAREVHDVVGHSLSINLLHVTAARHALQQHADVDDAIDSLTEAERVGRSAMGDLRRTVAVLAAGPGETQPMPDARDIEALVARSAAAGLEVTFVARGDLAKIDPARGLGLFRIAQESLGNIARHAPRSSATLSLSVEADGVRLCVRNTLPDGPVDAVGGGSGLPGMAARAEQIGAALSAGVVGAHWCVEVVVARVEAKATSCVVKRVRLTQRGLA